MQRKKQTKVSRTEGRKEGNLLVDDTSSLSLFYLEGGKEGGRI